MTAFDRAALTSVLDDLEAKLADLHTVDAVLALRSDRAQASEDAGFGSGPMSARVVSIGVAHPFRVAIQLPGAQCFGAVGAFGEPQALVDTLTARGRQWSAGVMEPLRARIRPLARPVASAFEEAVERLGLDVIHPLGHEVQDNVAHLASLSNWNGAAADQFEDYFYTQIVSTRERQEFAAQVICWGLAGSKAVVESGQQALMGLATAARDAVDLQLQERARTHATAGSSTSTWVMLAATAFAILGAAPTAGASVAAGGAVVSGLATGTSALLQLTATQLAAENTLEFPFTATSAESSASQVSVQLSQIEDMLLEQGTRLQERLRELGDIVAGDDAGDRLAPRSPRVVRAAPHPSAWHHESAPR